MSSIFISYSHRDEVWKDRLLTHLEGLPEEQRPEVWHDRLIGGGADWLAKIGGAMQRCRIAVLLVSPDFLQSKFIRSTEVPELLRRREREGMCVYPILLKSCLWKRNAWLAKLQIRPTDAVPLASLGDPGSGKVDDVLTTIAEEILSLFESLPPETPAVSHDPAVQAYLGAVAAETGELKLVGLAQNLRIGLKIDEAYVPLRVTTSTEEELDEFGRADPKRPGERREETDSEVEQLFVRVAESKKRGCVILGMPGAGKTTAARRICWRLAVSPGCAPELGLPAGILPVLLPLRRLEPAKIADGLEAFLGREVERLIGGDQARELALDRRPQLLWVFDGLDEVVDEATRAAIGGKIQQLLWTRKQDRFLVTSRYAGYRREAQLGRDFLPCHVRELAGAEVAGFVQRWYAAAASALGSQVVRADDEARSLLGILNQSEYRIGNLRGLRTNPLLLTILCLVHHQDRNLPGRRVELYQRCVRVLLEHWRREVRVEQGARPYSAGDAENALAFLAWWLHQEERRTAASLSEAGAQLVETLAELPADSGLPRSGREFLEKMRDDSGVLVPAGPAQIGFLHQTFQEYLAARYAVEERRSADLVARLGESWWRETTLLALAQGSRPFCREFFQALANTGDFSRHGELIDQCIEEAAFFVPEPWLQRLLAPGTAEPERIEILKRLRTRPSPAVAEACRTLVEAPGELGQLAREILGGQGVGIAAAAETGSPRVTTDARTGLRFVWIAPGRFRMGAENISDRERPVHGVGITRGFWLSSYPVTNEDYQRYLEANPNPQAQRPAFWDNARFNGKRQPVVGVNWEDASAYCRWAEGRLPTEAEWEYACRAGSSDDYCFGNDPARLKEYAWFGEDFSSGSTHPVGQQTPNRWGLYDMHGNVWEWCADWFGKYEAGEVTDPTGPKQGVSRVLRGGSWNSPAEYCRSAYRNRDDPAYRSRRIGFRVVLAPR